MNSSGTNIKKLKATSRTEADAAKAQNQVGREKYMRLRQEEKGICRTKKREDVRLHEQRRVKIKMKI